MKALCNKGLKPRHHRKIREFLNDDNIQFDETAKFQEFMELEPIIQNMSLVLTDISETASQEYSNETLMNKMQADWEPLEFTLNVAEGKDSYIISGEAIEAIQTALDDHVIKT